MGIIPAIILEVITTIITLVAMEVKIMVAITTIITLEVIMLEVIVMVAITMEV